MSETPPWFAEAYELECAAFTSLECGSENCYTWQLELGTASLKLVATIDLQVGCYSSKSYRKTD